MLAMSRLLQEIKALEQKHLIRNQLVWGDETRGGSGVEGCSRLVKSIYLERCDIIRTISLSGKPPKTRVVLRIEPSGGLTGVKPVKVKREKCVISLAEHFPGSVLISSPGKTSKCSKVFGGKCHCAPVGPLDLWNLPERLGFRSFQGFVSPRVDFRGSEVPLRCWFITSELMQTPPPPWAGSDRAAALRLLSNH